MKRLITVVMAGIVIITFFLMGLWIYADHSVSQIGRQGVSAASYNRHYALVSGDRSGLWQKVYDSARQEAENRNDYLEWTGADAPVAYTMEDCMRIASASRVDGIILHKGAEDEMTQLIDEAQEQNIPVITTLTDDTSSTRTSFVGLNSYQMGEIYGQEILKVLHDGTNIISVLMNKDDEASSSGLLYSQIVQVVEQGKSTGQSAQIQAVSIDTGTSFQADEDIRDIFLSSQSLPDVMVCLDSVLTECVCQALVDYNEVGNISAIGYYASDTTLDAISKGVMYSTVTFDAGEIGQVCVAALDEYWAQGNVNSYFNVGLSVVNQENVTQFLAASQEAPEEPAT